MTNEGGWRCSRCDTQGDAVTWLSWSVCGRRLVPGDPGWKDVIAAAGTAPLHASDLPKSPPPARPPPPAEELAAFLEACAPGSWDKGVTAWAAERLGPAYEENPEALDDILLAIGKNIPAWSMVGDPPREKSWHEKGYHAILRLYDAQGVARSVRARSLTRQTPKAFPPHNYGTQGLVLANGTGRRVLRDGEVVDRIVVAEGEPAFLAWCLWAAEEATPVAVFGIFSGSWDMKIGARLPLDATVLIATDDNKAGNQYETVIRASLKGQPALRWSSSTQADELVRDGGIRALRWPNDPPPDFDPDADLPPEDPEDPQPSTAPHAPVDDSPFFDIPPEAEHPGAGPKEDWPEPPDEPGTTTPREGSFADVDYNDIPFETPPPPPKLPPPSEPGGDDGPPPPQPQVILGPDLARVVDETLTALGHVPNLYQQAGIPIMLVRRPLDRGGDRLILHSLWKGPHALREILDTAAKFVRIKIEKGKEIEVEVSPPKELAEILLQRGHLPTLRPIQAVVETPVLRPDGSLLDTPGWDKKTRLYFDPKGEIPPIPEKPTLAQAKLAAEKIFRIFSQFPFVNKAARSAWFASLITPFVRDAIDGSVPIFMVEAAASRTGKSLLANLVGLIACGDRGMAATPAWEDDAEAAKSILGFACAGERCVLLDNCVGDFGWPSLDMAITTGRLDRRRLGTNEAPAPDARMVWYATSNNANLMFDIVGRLLMIRLDARCERPEERSNFAIEDIRAYVREKRTEIVAQVLTIVRAWVVAGRPAPEKKLVHFGGFEAWSAVVRHLIVWLGEPDPNDCRLPLTQGSRDTVKNSWKRLSYLLYIRFGNAGWSARSAVEASITDRDLNEAIRDVIPKAKEVTAQMLGIGLREIEGKVHAGLAFKGTAPSGKSAALWQLEVVDEEALERFKNG